MYADTQRMIVSCWRGVALETLRARALHQRRFGAFMLGACMEVGMRILGRGNFTAWVRKEGVLDEIFGDRFNQSVVPLAAGLLVALMQGSGGDKAAAVAEAGAAAGAKQGGKDGAEGEGGEGGDEDEDILDRVLAHCDHAAVADLLLNRWVAAS